MEETDTPAAVSSGDELIPLAKGADEGRKVSSLLVSVTPDIIDTAMPANSGHCMISDAVKLAAKAKKWRISKVLTDLQTIRFTDLKKRIRYVCFTPRVGQLALLSFDQGVKPEPFQFRLKAVQILPHVPRGRKRPKARIAVKLHKETGTTKGRPIKHGGDAIPLTVGLRREFGMRLLGVWKPPTETATATSS